MWPFNRKKKDDKKKGAAKPKPASGSPVTNSDGSPVTLMGYPMIYGDPLPSEPDYSCGLGDTGSSSSSGSDFSSDGGSGGGGGDF